jgi:hypothetical protein
VAASSLRPLALRPLFIQASEFEKSPSIGELEPLGAGTSLDDGQEILADAELSLEDLLAAGHCSKQVLPLPLPPLGEMFQVRHGNQKFWSSVESHEFLVLVGSEAFRRQYKAPNARTPGTDGRTCDLPPASLQVAGRRFCHLCLACSVDQRQSEYLTFISFTQRPKVMALGALYSVLGTPAPVGVFRLHLLHQQSW